MAVIRIQNETVAVGEPTSYLSTDISAASSTLTVKNISGFAIDQVLLIGEFGAENSEIVKTHDSTAPTGSTITLAANTVFAHASSVKVTVILYDQVEFSTATTSGGSKSVLSTVSFWADSNTTNYTDTASSTGFYYTRFKNTITSAFSSYTDEMAVTGWSSNTVGYMVDRALRNLSLDLSDILTIEDCYEWLNAGIRLIQGKLKRWVEHYTYNAVIGQTERGINTVSMPSDAYDRETNKSIIGVRIGSEKKLTYLSPVEFDAQLGSAKTTQVTTQAEISDTTLEIDNSYDFRDTGTIDVFISGTKYNITYTGVTRSATVGILTGVPASGDGSITVQIPVDTNVWQDETEGIPLWFTVRNSALEWTPMTDGNEDNKNIYSDYAKVATSVDSDGDTIDYQRFDMLQSYLTFRMKMKTRNDGELDFQDGYFTEYREKLNDSIRTMAQNNKFPMRPVPNKMGKRGGSGRADLQRLPISDQ